MTDILKSGSRGLAVSTLQTQLSNAGHLLDVTGEFDDATESAVRAFQAARGLVVDGKVGNKTRAALTGQDTSKLMRESDLVAAANQLGIPLASIKAVNAVESNGNGFLSDGRVSILFERHVFYRRIQAHGVDPTPHALRFPGIVNPKRGGYAGGAAEHARLATAVQVCRAAALEATSWGAFQVMGFHWQALGYESVEAFVASQQESEGAQLAAFVKFIEADPALHKALIGRKWAAFARGYNGPAYAENLYDLKLARAYERFATSVAA